jgi:signal transduction histidine kinase
VGTGTVSSTAGARRIFDVSDEELSLEVVLSFFRSADRSDLSAAIERCAETGEPFDLELQMTSDAELEQWVHLRGERVEADGSPTIRGAVQDVTERKEREQRLMVSNRVLRHNLRNDLTGMIAFSDELDRTLADLEAERTDPDGAGGETDAADADAADADASDADESLAYARELTDKIADSASDLKSIAERFRQFERTVERTDTDETVPVGSVVEDVVAEFRGEHSTATITTDVTSATVSGPREELAVPVRELVDNALEHADGETSTVGVSVSTVAGGRVIVRIADDGPGIPEMEQKVLKRGEETPLMHGSGLGLWLVNWYATRLNGRVTIDDNSPRGTVVRLDLPTADA